MGGATFILYFLSHCDFEYEHNSSLCTVQLFREIEYESSEYHANFTPYQKKTWKKSLFPYINTYTHPDFSLSAVFNNWSMHVRNNIHQKNCTKAEKTSTNWPCIYLFAPFSRPASNVNWGGKIRSLLLFGRHYFFSQNYIIFSHSAQRVSIPFIGPISKGFLWKWKKAQLRSLAVPWPCRRRLRSLNDFYFKAPQNWNSI